jgi:hypothetical protein
MDYGKGLSLFIHCDGGDVRGDVYGHAYDAPYDALYDASYDDGACHLCKLEVGIDGNLHAYGRIYFGMPCCLFCN